MSEGFGVLRLRGPMSEGFGVLQLRGPMSKEKAMKMKKGFRQMVDEAKARVKTLSLDESRKKLGQDGVVFVDLRDVRELEREGQIPGAFHCPRGMLEFWLDPDSPYHKP